LHKKLEIQNLRYHHLSRDSNVISWTYNISKGEEQIRHRTNNIPRERLVALVKECNKKMKTNKEGIEICLKKEKKKPMHCAKHNQLTCLEDEAKATKAKNPQKMSHLNIHRKKRKHQNRSGN